MSEFLWFVIGINVGVASALHFVGYGVLGGLIQMRRLWRYRRGTCTCRLCK
jgi:hypothetical protein